MKTAIFAPPSVGVSKCGTEGATLGGGRADRTGDAAKQASPKGDLQEIRESVGCNSDWSASHAVARWGYGIAVTGNANAWLKAKTYQPVNASYMVAFC
jgi:hypothetical protein